MQAGKAENPGVGARFTSKRFLHRWVSGDFFLSRNKLHSYIAQNYGRFKLEMELFTDKRYVPAETSEPQATATMMCTLSSGGADACHGDSGGPLVTQDPIVLYGVVSYGYGCGHDDRPGIYHYVPSTVNWIRRTSNMFVNNKSFVLFS